MNLNIINSILFHPRKAPDEMKDNDILIKVEQDIKVGIRHHIVSPLSPNILFFHGNGEIGAEYNDIAKVFNQKNINFIVADFRGYGFSNGIPNVFNTPNDAHIILDYILNFLISEYFSGPLIIMGRSLGSVSALELSKRYPKDFIGLIIESGFIDEKPLLKLMGVDTEKIGYVNENGFLHNQKIENYKGPLLVIHAEKDHIIPFEHGEKMISISNSENKELIPIGNANHNNILSINPDLYFNKITEFISKCK
tara:strand:+ start:448 stop:1203 length:756 start_codon:yes stop_codon:yes gene_type:complete